MKCCKPEAIDVWDIETNTRLLGLLVYRRRQESQKRNEIQEWEERIEQTQYKLQCVQSKYLHGAKDELSRRMWETRVNHTRETLLYARNQHDIANEEFRGLLRGKQELKDDVFQGGWFKLSSPEAVDALNEVFETDDFRSIINVQIDEKKEMNAETRKMFEQQVKGYKYCIRQG